MPAPRAVLALGLAVVAALAGAQAGWIHLKAELAQHLLARSWERIQQGAAESPPWPWADTVPVAELSVVRLGRRLLVLSGASGRVLAFGPAHVAGSAQPGQIGNSVLTGHRDTHFAFLRRLRLGDVIDLTDRHGRRSSYRVQEASVLHAEDLELSRDAGRKELTLVTCYPFDAVVPGGPLRYVVRAVDPGFGVEALLERGGVGGEKRHQVRKAWDKGGSRRARGGLWSGSRVDLSRIIPAPSAGQEVRGDTAG